MVTFSVTLTDP